MAPRTPAGLRESVGQGEVERAWVWASQGWVAEGEPPSFPALRVPADGPAVETQHLGCSPVHRAIPLLWPLFILTGPSLPILLVKKLKLRGAGFARGHTAGCGGLRPVLGPHSRSSAL